MGLLTSKQLAATAVTLPMQWPTGTYVARVQKNLERVAAQLAKVEWHDIVARYNHIFNCAEIVSADRGVIARVIVQGECGSAETAIVRTNLGESAQELFREELQRLKVRFEPLYKYL